MNVTGSPEARYFGKEEGYNCKKSNSKSAINAHCQKCHIRHVRRLSVEKNHMLRSWLTITPIYVGCSATKSATPVPAAAQQRSGELDPIIVIQDLAYHSDELVI